MIWVSLTQGYISYSLLFQWLATLDFQNSFLLPTFIWCLCSPWFCLSQGQREAGPTSCNEAIHTTSVSL